MQNGECRMQLQYIRLRINPNPIAKHKHYPNPKITQRAGMESDYREFEVGDFFFWPNKL